MAFKDRLYAMPVVGTGLRVQDRYRLDAGDQFAGSIGFFAFLSLFPLMLLALSVAGFVLVDASDSQIAEVAQAIQDAIPGFSAALGGDGDTGVGKAIEAIIANRGAGGIIGAVVLLFSGLKVINAAQTATVKVFRLDMDLLRGAKAKAKQVGALVILGLLALAGTAAGSAIGVVTQIELLGVMEVLGPVLVAVGTFVLDVGLFLAAYRVFGTREGPPLRTLVPGAVLAGLGWTMLKLVGSAYVSSQVDNASELYGAIGGVIGLMLLLYLAGRLYVYGAELSAVRAPDPTHPAFTEDQEPAIEHRADPDAATTRTDEPLFGDEPGLPARAPNSAEAQRALLAPSASDETRQRLASMPDPEPREGQGRQALAFAVAVGALAGLVGVLRPWDSGDD